MTQRQKLNLGCAPQRTLFDNDIGGALPSAATTAFVADVSDKAALEQQYLRTADLTHRRLYAQFFTPAPIADLMVEMATPLPGMRVLDPACGTGILVEALRKKSDGLRITALDLDPLVLSHLRGSPARVRDLELIESDYLAWPDTRQFDVIVANPPYLKYQHFDCEGSAYERLEEALDVSLSKFSNLYVLFILESYRRLKPGGKMVFIVPGEWTNSNFGTPFKQFLAREGCLTRLIYFSHLTEQFDDALTTACILELVKPSVAHAGSATFSCWFVSDGASIAGVQRALGGSACAVGVAFTTFNTAALASQKKWDFLLDGINGVDDDSHRHPRLQSWCGSRRGIATGANEFFHVRPSRASERQLQPNNLIDCVGGARHIRGVIFDRPDLEALRVADQPCLLWNLRRPPSEAELQYVHDGELIGLPKRYLLSKRRPWYSMERANIAPVWVGVFSRTGLKAIRNRAGVAHLTTFHGLTPHLSDPVLADALVVVLNSAYAGRAIQRTRRVFGAGLEKMEPADLLDICLPALPLADASHLNAVAALLAPMDAELRVRPALSEALSTAVDSAISRLADGLAAQDPQQQVPVDDQLAA